MKAAIVAIGDELTCGYRLDTNSQFISQRLSSVPLDVVLHLTVPDTTKAIHEGLATALQAADVVIATGGLGPTEDDLTRQAVATYFGLTLEENAEALDRIRERFYRRNLHMPESNRQQAQVPAGSQTIQNDRGTAPGFYLHRETKHLFVTPGIPYEMDGMLEGFILPRLRELAGDDHHVRRTALKVYGLPESKINEIIRPLLTRGSNPLLGLLPHRGTITVEITASGDSTAKADTLLLNTVERLRELLGKYIISEDERDLPQVVADLLLVRDMTVAVNEIGTGGLVAARLTKPDGYDRWFRNSHVADPEGWPLSSPLTDNRMQQAASEMACAARKNSNVELGIGVGPISTQMDDTRRGPYTVAYAAVDLQGVQTIRRLSFNGDRVRAREWIADSTLALAREVLLGIKRTAT